MAQIQYTENGVFLEYIEKEELVDKLNSRIAEGDDIAFTGSDEEKAKYLGIHPNSEVDFTSAVLERTGNLRIRRDKLLDKLNKGE